MEAMQDYAWPGNVRELQNYIERAVVLAPGDELTCELLPETVLGGKPPAHRAPRAGSGDPGLRAGAARPRHGRAARG